MDLFRTPEDTARELQRIRANLPKSTSAEAEAEMRATLAAVGRKPFDSAKAASSLTGPADAAGSSSPG